MWARAKRQRTAERDLWKVDNLAWRLWQKRTARGRADAKARVRRACKRLVSDRLIVRVSDGWVLPPETQEEARDRRRRNVNMGPAWKQEARERKAKNEAGAREDHEQHRRQIIRERAKRRITPAARAKLVKMLGMLGSAHDGEVASAGRQAEVLRKKLDRTWEELVIPAAFAPDVSGTP